MKMLMTKTILNKSEIIEDVPLILNFEFTEASFFEFCQLNRDLRIERDADGMIHIMAPTGFETGKYNADLVAELIIWNRKHKTGVVGESNTGYRLPNGAIRAPDVSWVSNERLANLSKEEFQRFAPVCPDFSVEILSPSDNLSMLKKKMQEYIENGCRLGWLIDRVEERVFIYRTDGTISLVKSFDEKLTGEDVLPGFEIVLSNLGQ